LKSDYRRFNIRDIQPGDDYGAMEQALKRRYTRLQKGEGKLPDLLLIDGGKGQINAACKALEELQITDVRIIGVAKGPGRKPGLETLHIHGEKDTLALPTDSPALHLIQQMRRIVLRSPDIGSGARKPDAHRRWRKYPGLVRNGVSNCCSSWVGSGRSPGRVLMTWRG
jgi:excinuclease ABC subunit C